LTDTTTRVSALLFEVLAATVDARHRVAAIIVERAFLIAALRNLTAAITPQLNGESDRRAWRTALVFSTSTISKRIKIRTALFLAYLIAITYRNRIWQVVTALVAADSPRCVTDRDLSVRALLCG
jgi:hypothetical protein